MKPSDASPTLKGRPSSASAREEQLSELFDDHFDFIWRLLRRFGLSDADADDAAQRVFLTASEKLAEICSGKERKFLYGVAMGVVANAKRSLARRRETSDDMLASAATNSPSPHEHVEIVRAWTLLDELLGQLPAKLQRVLVLAEIEQLEVAEIVALEQIPVGTAASRLRKGRELFKELLRGVEHRNPFKGNQP